MVGVILKFATYERRTSDAGIGKENAERKL
jgi:hypothetical protein